MSVLFDVFGKKRFVYLKIENHVTDVFCIYTHTYINKKTHFIIIIIII